MGDQVPVSESSIGTVAMAGGMQPYPVNVGIPLHLAIQPQPQQIQIIEAPVQQPVPVQLAYNPGPVQVNTLPQVQPHHQQQTTMTLQPVQVAVINHGQPAKLQTLKPKKRKKQSDKHHGGSSGQQQTISKKKKSKYSYTHDMDEIDITEKPAAKKSKRKRSVPQRIVQTGMHSKAIQTHQSKEELMMDLSQMIKTKLKEHVDTMETDELKAALHRLAELQPGLVFDVVVGQLATRKKEKDKTEAQPPQTTNYSEIVMKRNGRGYIIQGHLFEGDKIDKKRGKMYLKCHRCKSACKARAKIVGNEAIILQKNHNHDPPNIIELRFSNRAREEATKEEHRKKPISKVYQIVKEAFLAEAKDEEERKQMEASIPQFKSVEGGMRMSKSKVFSAPINVSMLDMSFDALRDEIMGTGSDGIQAVDNGNRDNTQGTDVVEVHFNQLPQGTNVTEHNTSSNLQTNVAVTTSNNQNTSLQMTVTPHIQASSVPQDSLLANTDYQSNMQIHGNEQGNMQIHGNEQGNVQIHGNEQVDMQIHVNEQGNMQIHGNEQVNMQIHGNEQSNVPISNETTVAGNTAAVQTQSSISSNLQQL